MLSAEIEDRRSDDPVAVRCRGLGESRSGDYARSHRPAGVTATRRETLATQIREVHVELTGRYGSPRLAIALSDRGVACGVNTVAKPMNAHGIRAKAVRPHHRLEPPDAGRRERPRPRPLAGPAHTAWGMGITDVPTLEGGLVLALVVALLSRRIVGRAMAATRTSRLVADALEVAVR